MRIVLFAVVVPVLALGGEPRQLGPADDARIIAHVPVLSPELRLQALTLRTKKTLAARPRLSEALRTARADIVLSRQHSDPRYLGYAQAALAPWWGMEKPPVDVQLLRAIIRQSQHDFTGAMADLQAVLARRPDDGQAWMTLSSLQLVRGELAKAKESCAALERLATELLSTACLASVDGASGKSRGAYARLREAWKRAEEEDPAQRAWVLTLLAELATRRGDAAAAERHFREALAQDATDGYLLGAWADFLLDHGRAAEVVPLLEGHLEADGLLLRFARAKKRLGAVDFARARNQLAARFEASRLRGDRIHQREEAIFALHVEERLAEALAFAEENWRLQREPADVRILLEAAIAARAPARARDAAAWVRASGLEEPRIAALVAALGPEVSR